MKKLFFTMLLITSVSLFANDSNPSLSISLTNTPEGLIAKKNFKQEMQNGKLIKVKAPFPDLSSCIVAYTAFLINNGYSYTAAQRLATLQCRANPNAWSSN